MPNYTTLLKTWGDTGAEYPTGYSYIEGEQPVDAWDNYLIHNVVKDLQGLIDTTNNDLLLRSGGSLLSDLSTGGFKLVGDSGSVDFSGSETNVDGVGVASFKTDYDGHTHDGRYTRLFDGSQIPVYSTITDVPSTIGAGEAVYIDNESALYVEDGN